MNQAGEGNQMMFADRMQCDVPDHHDSVVLFRCVTVGIGRNDFEFSRRVFVQSAADFRVHFRHAARRVENARARRVFTDAFKDQADSGGDFVEVNRAG